jgi:hypothetical protein
LLMRFRMNSSGVFSSAAKLIVTVTSFIIHLLETPTARTRVGQSSVGW